MRKILLSILTIGFVAIVAIGATVAYFSATATSTGNTFTAGTLTIGLLNQNTSDPLQFSMTNWAPGGETFVNFDVLNSGTLLVNLRGFAAGTWESPPGGSDKVKVIKVERWDSGGWQKLASNPAGITGYFYYSPDGTDASLYPVGAGGRAQMRLTVKFDSTAGNEYQDKIFTASITAEAKQTNALTW